MKTITLILLTLLLTISTVRANEFNYLETNLKSFTVEVLSNIDKPFIINDDLIDKITLFYKPNQNNLTFLKRVLNQNNYSINIKNGIYFITKDKEVLEENKTENTKVRYIHLNFLNYKDIDSICKLYEIKYTYLKETNKLAVNTTYEKYQELKSNILRLDHLPSKMKIKLSIFETNLSKIKEHETLINFNLNKMQKSLLDVVLGSSVNINTKSDYDNVSSILKFLDTNSLTDNLTSTIINLEHNNSFFINSSTNIPYLSSSNEIKDTSINEVNSYDYKDVGLKVKIDPKILKNFVNLDFDFEYSQLVSNLDNLPITTKKTLKQKITLDTSSKYFILSGINNSSKSKKIKKVPFLSDIPYIGDLFKNQHIDNSTTTTTVLIEVINFNLLSNFSNVNETLTLRDFDTCEYLGFCD